MSFSAHPNCLGCPDTPRGCSLCLVSLGGGIPTLGLSEPQRAELNRRLVKEGFGGRYWDNLAHCRVEPNLTTYSIALPIKSQYNWITGFKEPHQSY